MNDMERSWLNRLMLMLSSGLTAAVLAYSLNTGRGTGTILGAYTISWAVALAVEVFLLGLALSALLISFTPAARVWQQRLEKVMGWFARLRWLNAVLLAGMILAIFWMIYEAQADRLGADLPRWWLLWLGALIGTFLLRALWRGLDGWQAWLVSVMGMGVLFVAASFFSQVSNYPFSQGWSEGSRFYNASLYYAPSIYGRSLALPVLHPTRYLLQSLPFILPGTGIAVHRFWQALLWMALPLLTSWLLARRLHFKSGLKVLIFTLYGFIFLYQGPVYYHLVVCAMPVLIGFDRARPWKSLLWVLLASVWAGISRVNWWPVPGALAVLLYLLEEQQQGRNLLRYLTWPAVWGVAGTAVAFASNQIYESLSGNPPEVFGSALESPLLWNRMWPNSTYQPGIFWMTVIVLVPVIALFWVKLWRSPHRWYWARSLGMLGLLGVFLAGGLIVSMKIGGGSNLHNLDAFLMLQCVAVVYLGMDGFKPDKTTRMAERPAGLRNALLIAALVLVPVAQTVLDGRALALPEENMTTENLASLQQQVRAADAKGEILFLSEKQLVTFKYLDVKNFDPDHEKVFLMEMAMANNQAYLQKFYSDLQNHRYSLIVAEPLNANMQNVNYAFSEENNAWVERVELPVLQYYELVDKMPQNNVYLYAPKP